MKIILLLAALLSFTAEAAEQFPYDRKLAIDLAVAYVRSHFRERPDHSVPGLNFKNPKVYSAIAKGSRKLVVVSFSSSKDKSGAFVMLELCNSNGLLVAAESGVVNNINNYLSDINRINSNSDVEASQVCPND